MIQAKVLCFKMVDIIVSYLYANGNDPIEKNMGGSKTWDSKLQEKQGTTDRESRRAGKI